MPGTVSCLLIRTWCHSNPYYLCKQKIVTAFPFTSEKIKVTSRNHGNGTPTRAFQLQTHLPLSYMVQRIHKTWSKKLFGFFKDSSTISDMLGLWKDFRVICIYMSWPVEMKGNRNPSKETETWLWKRLLRDKIFNYFQTLLSLNSVTCFVYSPVSREQIYLATGNTGSLDKLCKSYALVTCKRSHIKLGYLCV